MAKLPYISNVATPIGKQLMSNNRNIKESRQEGFSTAFVSTPIGKLFVCANENGVTAAFFDCDDEVERNDGNNPHLNLCLQEFELYFAGKLNDFSVKLTPRGTDFQKRVWRQLSVIPFGETTYYGQIANRLENPNAVRAVGTANGKNPISIIVPCHRVIGKDGTLTGYAGGLSRKQWLLEHEQKHTQFELV